MSFDARWRLLLPLYLGLAGMIISTVAALGTALDSADFVVRAHAFALAGLAASFIGALFGRNPSLLGAAVGVVVFPALVMSNAGAPSTRAFFPDESLSDHTLLLPTLAVWGIIGLAFAQVNRPNSIFIFVCGLVVFGLTGTVNINESLLISFLIFLMSTFFVWGYGNVLGLRERALAARQTLPEQPARWAHTQIGMGVALTALVFLVAVATGYPAYKYTWSFFVTPFQRSFLRPPPLLRTLQNYSGFGEEFTLTGGPIELSDAPALTVEADAPALWRGLAYDRYDSRGWSRTHAVAQIPMLDGNDGWWRLRRTRRSLRPEGEAVRSNHQKITSHIVTGEIVIAAAAPVAFRAADRRGRAALDRYGCMRRFAAWQADPSYEVISEQPVASAEQLAAAADQYAEQIRDTYLAVPSLTRRQLQDLAEEITRDCKTPYDKVIAVQDYLYGECRYTLDVPPIPPRQDAVAYFLLKMKIGACDLYSSALVVLLRLSGVPARVATGYASGERDPQTGLFHVTAADAHAWAEVYFPGIGWVTFDPPSQSAPDRLSWLAKLFQPGWAAPMLRGAGRKALGVVIALLLINALILAVSGASPVAAGARWIRRRRTLRNPRQRVAFAYQSVCHSLRRRGLTRHSWETPSAFARRVADASAVPRRLREVGVPAFSARFLALRYGAAEPSSDQVSDFETHARSLARRIRRAKEMESTPEPPGPQSSQ